MENTCPGDDFIVLGSGYEAGFDAGYAKGYTDGMDAASPEQLERLVLALQAHGNEHGWQDVDEPIAALLSWRRPEARTQETEGRS